ncbi:MAG: PilZ domain-containing protein [Acidobacteria bacterium]|nr:PilZ domain-containing protein [Acidobacteriota bacterium]MBU1474213.1 PilZ domain-containing protein [Acidobacteriota bacterium]MBU2438967.1 PilZ domain-containing protein [Acidobacteriota bacterium]
MHRKIRKETCGDRGVNEQGFKLPLKTIVQGMDGSGRPFSEETVLSYISHNGSSFRMSTPVLIGTDLRLTVDLPPQLSDNEDLKLIIKGKVVFVEAAKDDHSMQRVSLKFENRYIIQSDKD